ncbi:hypothetical protein OIV83_006089 [Microbotryomycetes sp. JL201]|nr:hypothetical protein OIV83_006089 [Microbotryomycetes sp. JL201]
MKASAHSQGYGPAPPAPWQQQAPTVPSAPRPGTNHYGVVDVNLSVQQQELQQQHQQQQQQQQQQAPGSAAAAAAKAGPSGTDYSTGANPPYPLAGPPISHGAQSAPAYPYQTPYPQPAIAALDAQSPASGRPDADTQMSAAAASAGPTTSNIRPSVQLVSADRKPRVPLADRDIYMMRDDPGYYDSPSSVESDDDFPHTPADAGNTQSYVPTTNRGHKLSSSAKHIRRGRLGTYPHTDAGFEPESSLKRRKLLSGTGANFGIPSSSSSRADRQTLAIAPNFHLIPRDAEPMPAPVVLPPVAQSPLDLLMTPGMQYSLGPKNQTLKMLAMSATGLIEEEQALITNLSRVCAGLRGEGFEFRWSGDDEVRQQRLKEREQEEQEERIKREARRRAEREERERKEELERKERERKDEDERIENERRAAEKEAARAQAEAEAKAKADAAAAEAAEAAEAEAERQAEQLKVEQHQQAKQIEQRQQQIEDVKSEEKQIEALAASTSTDATAAKADAAKSAAADASAMDVDDTVSSDQQQAVLADSISRRSSVTATTIETAALPSLPEIGAKPAVAAADEDAGGLNAAESASKAPSAASTPGIIGNGTPNQASTSDENSAVPPSTTAEGVETVTVADQNEEDEADETGGETETVRRTSRRVAKRTYGDSGAGSTSDDDAYEDAAEDRRIAAAAVKRRAGQFDDDDEAGTGSGPGSRRGDDTPPRVVEEELPEYAKRLVDPEVYVRSLFVSEGKVELPAVAQMGAPPPAPGTMDVLSPNEQEVLLHDCLTDLHRFLADTLEYRNRVAEIRDGVLGIERRRKGMWKVVRTVAADWLEEEEQAAAA